MSKENFVSIKFKDEDLAKIDEALKTIDTVLKNYLVTLTPAEIRAMPKASERTEPFVKKSLEYAESHPQFAPAYLSVPEMKIDVEAADALKKIKHPVEEILKNISDTIILSSSEAYVAALAYYGSVKQAVKMNQAGAKVIFEELKGKFEANGIKKKSQASYT
jgi:hypothetical protein